MRMNAYGRKNECGDGSDRSFFCGSMGAERMDVVVLLKVESELEIEDISATLGRESSVSFRKGQTLSVNTKAFARAFHLIGESLLKQEEVSLAQEDLFDKFHYFENSDLSALFDIKEDSQETIVTRNLWIIREKYKDQEDITFALKSFLNNNEKTLHVPYNSPCAFSTVSCIKAVNSGLHDIPLFSSIT